MESTYSHGGELGAAAITLDSELDGIILSPIVQGV
jgi:hypothetical protein